MSKKKRNESSSELLIKHSCESGRLKISVILCISSWNVCGHVDHSFFLSLSLLSRGYCAGSDSDNVSGTALHVLEHNGFIAISFRCQSTTYILDVFLVLF